MSSAEIDDLHPVVHFRVLCGRPLGQNSDLALQSVIAYPLFDIILPPLGMLRLVHRIHARGELEILTGYLLRADRYCPYRKAEPGYAPRRGAAVRRDEHGRRRLVFKACLHTDGNEMLWPERHGEINTLIKILHLDSRPMSLYRSSNFREHG